MKDRQNSRLVVRHGIFYFKMIKASEIIRVIEQTISSSSVEIVVRIK